LCANFQIENFVISLLKAHFAMIDYFVFRWVRLYLHWQIAASLLLRAIKPTCWLSLFSMTLTGDSG